MRNFIDPRIEEYIEQHTSPVSKTLNEIERQTFLRTIHPQMLSGKVLGNFLKTVSILMKPERILEVGTFTAYSSICLAAGLTKSGVLHSIEVNPELETTIRKNIKNAGLNERIQLHIGSAGNIIPKLNDSFDLVFIDADKENYSNYYDLVFDKVKSGGIIMADNALWDGKVINPKEKDKETKAIMKFNEKIQADMRVENTLLSVRDGVMLIRKL